MTGELTTEVLPRVSPAHHYANAVSQILKHRDLTGAHVCTTHRIVGLSTGLILHWDEADIREEGIIYAKAHGN